MDRRLCTCSTRKNRATTPQWLHEGMREATHEKALTKKRTRKFARKNQNGDSRS
jgi:hypothetical protein